MQRIQVTYAPHGWGARPAPRAIGRRGGSRGGRGRLRMLLLLLLAALLGVGVAGGLGAIGGGGGSNPPNTAQVRAEEAYAQQLSGNSPAQQQCLTYLWNRESGWDPNAVNTESGAYGIPQALGKGHPFNLGDWRAQIRWGLDYINRTSTQGPGGTPYGSPCAAWSHEQATGWY